VSGLRCHITGATGATGGAVVVKLLKPGRHVHAPVHQADERSVNLRKRGVECGRLHPRCEGTGRWIGCQRPDLFAGVVGRARHRTGFERCEGQGAHGQFRRRRILSRQPADTGVRHPRGPQWPVRGTRRLGWLGRAHVDGPPGSVGRSSRRFHRVASRELIFRAVTLRAAARCSSEFPTMVANHAVP
jgi:hypothetical protein